MTSFTKILPLTGIFLWYISSIMLNVHWKSTFRSYILITSSISHRYQYAMFFTTIQFAAGATASFTMLLSSGKLENLMPLSSWWRKGVVIGSLFYLGQLSTNMSLTMTSITLTHMIKTLEPLLALLWALTILKNTISCTSIIYMLIMLAGVFFTSYTEVTFNMVGVTFAITSNVCLSLRNLFIKLSKQNDKLTGLQLFFVSCLFGLFYSFLLSFLFSMRISTDLYYRFFSEESIKMGIYFSGQHILSYLLLYFFSITSHALLNCLKRALIIFVSAVLLGVKLPTIQILGIVITIYGSILYVYSLKKSSTRKEEDIRATDWNKTFEKSSEFTFSKAHKCIIILPFLFLLFLTLTSTLDEHETIKSVEIENSILDSIQYPKVGELKAIESLEIFKNKTKERNNLSGEATAVWTFDSHLPISSLEIIDRELNRRVKNIKIFCSNIEKCKESINSFRSESLSFEIIQLKAFELTKNTPLVSWVASHPINKIKSLSCFTAYFHKIMYLSALWKYGGITIDLALNVAEKSKTKNFKFSSSYEECMLDHRKISAIICNLPPEDKYTEYLMGKIIKLFMKNPKSCPFNSYFPEEINYHVPSAEIKFGLLGYGYTKNLGDEMQSIGSAHILPHIYTFINRQTFTNPDGINLTYIANAWWDNNGILFKKNPNLVTVPVSVHISPPAFTNINSSKSLLTAMAPIGARDLKTSELLNENGIESFFTGCITLWMTNPNKFTNSKRTNETIIVDLTWKLNPVPEDRTNIKYITHLYDETVNTQVEYYTQEEKFVTIYGYLMKYAQAKVVVTSRIHVALPCVAMGTPVIFVNSKEIWDGNKSPSSRVAGLLELFHTVDLYTMDEENALDFFKTFNWESPPPNPNPMKVDILKKKAKRILERIPELGVSLKVFELIS